MAPSVPSSTAHLTCLCGAVRKPGTLLASPTLPVQDEHVCHCTSCRILAGSLTPIFPNLKSAPSQASLVKCTAYKRNGPSGTSEEHHCLTCGTKLFTEFGIVNGQRGTGTWCCLAGIIERDPKQVAPSDEWVDNVVRITSHDYVSDIKDGGMAAILSPLSSGPCTFYPFSFSDKGHPALISTDITSLTSSISSSPPSPPSNAPMKASCHCGGVSLNIAHADFDTAPDPEVNDRFAEAGNRYIAQFCACRSCRLQSGDCLMAWTYIQPRKFTCAADGEPVVFGREAEKPGVNKGLSTLKHYWSSPEVDRSFCGICGSSVFYWVDDRPEVVDLAMGIVRAGSGAMAREWVSWRWRVSHQEEATWAEGRDAILERGKT